MRENVANNVAQGKVQDLTEQWKNGELKDGYYYIKLPTGRIEQVSHDSYQYLESETIKNRVEVLAPVPSYEEWQDTENRSLLTAEFSNEIDELNEENQQLKELLKECRNLINECISGDYMKELCERIDEVLK